MVCVKYDLYVILYSVCSQSELLVKLHIAALKIGISSIFFLLFFFHPPASIVPNLGILEVRLGGCENIFWQGKGGEMDC